MPYIQRDRRHELIDKLVIPEMKNAGELNFILTHIFLDYLFTQGECYQSYNDIVGAVENAKLELYRRKISEYETRKAKMNGDIF